MEALTFTDDEMALLINLFKSPIGGEVRDLLEMKITNRLSFDGNALTTAFREGQRSLALLMLASANAAKVVGTDNQYMDRKDADFTEDK